MLNTLATCPSVDLHNVMHLLWPCWRDLLPLVGCRLIACIAPTKLGVPASAIRWSCVQLCFHSLSLLQSGACCFPLAVFELLCCHAQSKQTILQPCCAVTLPTAKLCTLLQSLAVTSIAAHYSSLCSILCILCTIVWYSRSLRLTGW